MLHYFHLQMIFELIYVLLVVGDGGLQRALGLDLLVCSHGGPQEAAHLSGQPVLSLLRLALQEKHSP